jgi:hypothetical protein
MAKINLDRTLFIVIILVTCLVSCAISAGISTWITNSGINTEIDNKGSKGDTGPTGTTGPTGPAGATGSSGSSGATGVTGSSGSNGKDGTNGSNGATWYSGSGAPSNSSGSNGDYYLDTSTNAVYHKVSGSWVLQSTLDNVAYNSGWVDISNLQGQNVTLTHNLNTTDITVQIEGLDAQGNIHQKYFGLQTSTIKGWTQTYGEDANLWVTSMANTNDGGYVLTGQAYTAKPTTQTDFAMFLLKLDSSGGMKWYQTYNLQYNDVGYNVIASTDGGYAIAGYTYNSSLGGFDGLIVKTDSLGNILWNYTFCFANSDNNYAISIAEAADHGFAITGETHTEAKDYDMFILKTSSAGVMEWNHTYGGTNYDAGWSIIKANDDGFVVAGSNYTNAQYGCDAFLLKTDSSGTLEWVHICGYPDSNEYAFSVIQTTDNGYAVIGQRNTVGIWSSSASVPPQNNVFLFKTDENGIWAWDKNYGGDGDDQAYSLVQTSDGGFAILASSNESGSYDWILLKTTPIGNKEWIQTYGGNNDENAEKIVLTSDGGFALAGWNSTSTTNGYSTLSLIKTSSDGTIGWTKNYGGPNDDYAYSIISTNDGGYAAVGDTISSITGNASIYLVKTDENGAMMWSKIFGSPHGYTDASAIIQTSDGGYLITGSVYSNGSTLFDVYLLKTDADGNLLWTKSYGTPTDDYGQALIATSDGGYAIAGMTYSQSNNGNGYLVKVNASGTLQWTKIYNASTFETAISIVATDDNGYAIAGYTNSSTAGYADAALIKTDINGTLEWIQTYGSIYNDYGYTVIATRDGGYALVGNDHLTQNVSTAWLIKTYANGTMQWNQTYSGIAPFTSTVSVIQLANDGYALAGYSSADPNASSCNFIVITTNYNGTIIQTQTYAASAYQYCSIITTNDGGYIIAGNAKTSTGYDMCIIKPTITLELGLKQVSKSANTLTLYRGADDSCWQCVRVKIWKVA